MVFIHKIQEKNTETWGYFFSYGINSQNAMMELIKSTKMRPHSSPTWSLQ